MEWGEIFQRKTARLSAPRITITKVGRIVLNKQATSIFENKSVAHVLLLWRKEDRKIGIRPIHETDARAYSVKYGDKGNGAGFAAKTFLDYLRIAYDESRSYTARWNEVESLL